MRPLKKGANRTILRENIQAITNEDGTLVLDNKAADRLAAILGGAIDQVLFDMGQRTHADRAVFWRYMNHNTWNLTRSLKASNLLKDV